MDEKAPQIWETDDGTYDNVIGEVTVGQMNDIITEFGFASEDGDLSAEKSKELAEFAKEHDENTFGAILSELGYYPDELTEPDIARLKVCLMTPRLVQAQNHGDAIGDKGDRSLRRELCEYNDTLKEMMALHPDASLTELEEMLITSLMWSGASMKNSRAEARLLRRRLNGARAELAMQQFATSSIAESAGITYKATSIEGDLNGTDLLLDVPVALNDKITTTMHLRIDVKSDPKAVKALHRRREDEHKNYSFTAGGRVIMWSHLTEKEFGNKAMLGPDDAQRYGEIMLRECQEAARDLHDHMVSWNIGTRAVSA